MDFDRLITSLKNFNTFPVFSSLVYTTPGRTTTPVRRLRVESRPVMYFSPHSYDRVHKRGIKCFDGQGEVTIR